MSGPRPDSRAVAQTPGRVGFVSLGCPKALVDSERILTRLRAEGYEIAPSYDAADLVVVNTCGFIEEAVDESLEAIAEALRENGRVVVTGCLGGKADARLRERFPGLLSVSGPQAYEEVMAAVHRALPAPHDPFLDLVPPQGIRLTPRHYAYLKISEGCNHRCSFCIIPQLRGDLVSRPVGEVLEEAERLVAAGVRELLVISQDTSAYGVDLRYRPALWRGRTLRSDLVDLATALGELGAWVRLHYVYPYPQVDRLLPLMAEGRLLPYLDVPFQHASPRVLKAMRRPAAAEDNLARVRAWRAACPDLTVRSSFIVGFPGESEEDFETLLAFLEEAELDRVGCFKYSPVSGARANDLPDPVPEEVKQDRLERLMTLQARISAERLRRRVGQRLTVLLDAVEGDAALARGPGDAPEIDGRVHLPALDGMRPGDLLEVTVTGSDEHDLWARPAQGVAA